MIRETQVRFLFGVYFGKQTPAKKIVSKVFPKQELNLRLSDHGVEPYPLSQVALCVNVNVSVTVTVTVTVSATAQLGLEGTVLPRDQGDAGSIPVWGIFWKTNPCKKIRFKSVPQAGIEPASLSSRGRTVPSKPSCSVCACECECDCDCDCARDCTTWLRGYGSTP